MATTSRDGTVGPGWVHELRAKYTAGIAHAFVLHFSVRDYVAPGVGLRNYLAKLLGSTEVIAFYDRSQGITFPLASMRQAFLEAVGLNQQEDEALAALRAATGGGSAGDIPLPTDPNGALPLLETLLRQKGPEKRRAAVVIDYAETLAPAADKAMMGPADRTNLVTLCRWGTDPEIAASNNLVILVTNNLAELHPDVRAASAKYESILVPLPDYQERVEFVDHLRAVHDGVRLGPEMSTERLSAATAGLSRLHIEDIWLRAAASEELAVTPDLVRERKQDIIASEYGDVIEILEPRFGFELIGGLEHVKAFFRRNVIEPIKQQNPRRVPMGILLTGPAGCGKTAMVEAVAREAGINCVELKLEKILGGIVGTSERNLDKALRCIETLAPTLVFMDEIDQKVRRGGSGASDGGSSVNNNIFSRLLEFMSDGGHRGRIVFLAATNRPDLIDAALKRPGRFDKKVPFLLPNGNERDQIMAAMFSKYDLTWESTYSTGRLSDLRDALEGWTGAELEALVLKAWEISEDDGRRCVAYDDLLAARNRLSPSTADVQLMTMLAIRECNDLDLLPEGYRAQLADRAALDKRLEELAQPRGRREL